MNNSIHKRSRQLSLGRFADRLQELAPQLMQNLMKQERNYLSRGLITLPQVWALRQVAEQGHCSMRRLAQQQGLKCPTVTGLVDRLVALGLLRRIHCEDDRRTVLAMITPKGRRIMQTIQAERRRVILRMFRQISARERARYLDIIEKIVRALTAAPARNTRGRAGKGRIL